MLPLEKIVYYPFHSLGEYIHDDTIEDAEHEGEQEAVEPPEDEVKHYEEKAEYLPRRQIYAFHTTLTGHIQFC